MKILTRYSKIDVDFEVLDPIRITDGSQYISISQAVEMVARGEVLNLHDYTEDSPIDMAEFFDVADHVEEINRNAEKVKQKIEEQKQKPDEKPVEKPVEKPEV